ncbi:MAG: hypothetical protein AB1467_06425 [Candidatus Diapherotrites archaeon]
MKNLTEQQVREAINGRSKDIIFDKPNNVFREIIIRKKVDHISTNMPEKTTTIERVWGHNGKRQSETVMRKIRSIMDGSTSFKTIEKKYDFLGRINHTIINEPGHVRTKKHPVRKLYRRIFRR